MSTGHVEDRGGVYYLAGTRISLDSIVHAFRAGSSPESIREDFEGLVLADVYGAISFYLDHQADVDAYLLRRKNQWAELERQGTPPSQDLRARLDRARSDATLP
ncbi:MAG: DUF433 domain-containing protein [Bryobacterales bacterium]|nr:DUF433 domain-containing protein [Bryobacterales bacterium]